MMKRLFSILFSALATITLLGSVIVPHHHHGDMVYIVVNHCAHGCDHDGLDDDEKHSTHHQDDKQASDDNCIARATYLISSQDEINNKIRPHEEDSHNTPFVPVLLCNSDSAGATFIYLTKRRYKDKTGFHELGNVNRANGLRAPPHSIA